MGNRLSKSKHNVFPNPVVSNQLFIATKTRHIPSQIQPPAYSIEHNASCKALALWKSEGANSRNYRYVIYVNNNNLLDEYQQQAQDLLLEHIQLCATIHKLNVWVKCLDYLSGEDSDTDAEREK
jgi:hypothetical protein